MENGKITILVGIESTTIRIQDEISGIEFVEVKLTPEQLSMALSRQAYTPCLFETRGVDKIGKKLEVDRFSFEIPESLYGSSHAKELREIAQSLLIDGWESDGNFSSQDTFLRNGDKRYAKCIIRRWV